MSDSRTLHQHLRSGVQADPEEQDMINGMETYRGHVRTPNDAIILFEACRIGLLPRVQRRLSEKERQSVTSGSVFVWDEREAGMRRWTDGKSWSASRVSGSFLTYREMEGKRGGSGFDKNANRDGVQGNEGDSDGGPDGYRYKPDGLMKQSFSITTNNGQHLHLISYFSRNSVSAQSLIQPSQDPQLRHIRPEKGMYPESTVHEQSSIPAVTRGPMGSPGHVYSPHRPYDRGAPYGYMPHPGWAPPSPMHTPPPHHPHYPSYYHHSQYPGQSPLQHMQYPPPPHSAYGQPPPMTTFDRPPPPLSSSGLPPPPAYPPPHSGSYHSSYAYPGGYAPYPSSAAPSQQPPPTLQHQMSHESRHSAPTLASAPLPVPEAEAQRKESRADSKQGDGNEQQTHSGSSATVSSGQTIPSISAMLNCSEGKDPPPRSSSRNSGGTPPRPLQDIPSHKLGFEANRDMQALRNLDKSTFKGY